MIVCDMCGKKISLNSITMTIKSLLISEDYELCSNCANKIKRYIKFEHARTSKKMTDGKGKDG